MTRSAFSLSVLFAVIVVPQAVDAHPSHVAIAEAEWNRESGKLEVAMRLRPEDVEEALTRMLRSERVDLEQTKDVDKHLTAYLAPHFVVSTKKGGQRQPIVWVGKEVDLRFVWVYFEVPMPKDTGDLQLSCTALMDVLPDQTNTVLLKDGEMRWSKEFTRHKPKQPWTASEGN